MEAPHGSRAEDEEENPGAGRDRPPSRALLAAAAAMEAANPVKSWQPPPGFPGTYEQAFQAELHRVHAELLRSTMPGLQLGAAAHAAALAGPPEVSAMSAVADSPAQQPAARDAHGDASMSEANAGESTDTATSVSAKQKRKQD